MGKWCWAASSTIRWPGSRTGDFLEDGKGVPGRGRRDLDGDLNSGQGDFLTGVCRDEKVLGLRHNGLQLRVWTAFVWRLHGCGGPMRHPLPPTFMAPSAARMATRLRVVSWSALVSSQREGPYRVEVVRRRAVMIA